VIDEDVVSTPAAPGATTQTVEVPAEWGLAGGHMEMVSQFPNVPVAKRLFEIPNTTGSVPAGSASNGQLVVPKRNPGLTDSIGAP
jgi:hypothetical protein